MPDIGIRLAIRAEGDVVNAYLASAGDMAGAWLLGSIDRAVAEAEPNIFDRWTALMAEIVSKAVEMAHGRTPTMTEAPAPEHERSGSA